MSRFEYPLIVREHHLDSYGHINNAVYLALAEEARWEMMYQATGLSMPDLHKMGKGPVILEINIKFMRELKLRQNIIITLEMVEWQGKVGKMRQDFVLPDGTVASTIDITFGLFDMQARRLVELDDFWAKAWGIEQSGMQPS